MSSLIDVSDDRQIAETSWAARLTTTLHTPDKERVTSMKITRNIGMLLLAIWLIVSGLAAFIPALGGLGVILAILAIAAGVFILLGR
jgi:hypothetical protein